MPALYRRADRRTRKHTHQKMSKETLHVRSCCPCVVPRCALLLWALSASMASINYKGVEADNEHMACSDHFTSAWWVMFIQCSFLNKKRPAVRKSQQEMLFMFRDKCVLMSRSWPTELWMSLQCHVSVFSHVSLRVFWLYCPVNACIVTVTVCDCSGSEQGFLRHPSWLKRNSRVFRLKQGQQCFRRSPFRRFKTP